MRPCRSYPDEFAGRALGEVLRQAGATRQSRRPDGFSLLMGSAVMRRRSAPLGAMGVPTDPADAVVIRRERMVTTGFRARPARGSADLARRRAALCGRGPWRGVSRGDLAIESAGIDWQGEGARARADVDGLGTLPGGACAVARLLPHRRDDLHGPSGGGDAGGAASRLKHLTATISHSNCVPSRRTIEAALRRDIGPRPGARRGPLTHACAEVRRLAARLPRRDELNSPGGGAVQTAMGRRDRELPSYRKASSPEVRRRRLWVFGGSRTP